MPRTQVVVAGLIAVCLAAAMPAGATMAIQKKAKDAGFDVTSCISCHNEKLPKKGSATQNARGQYLVDQKAERKAKEIDVKWLKDYVDNSAKK